MRRALVFCLALLALSCDDGEPEEDAGAAVDSGPAVDAGPFVCESPAWDPAAGTKIAAIRAAPSARNPLLTAVRMGA